MIFSGKIPFHVAARLTPRFWVPHLLRFATIRHYSRLFAIIRTIRDYSHYSLFAIRDYSLFGTIRCSLFATIRYSGFPDTPLSYEYKVQFKGYGPEDDLWLPSFFFNRPVTFESTSKFGTKRKHTLDPDNTEETPLKRRQKRRSPNKKYVRAVAVPKCRRVCKSI